MLSTLPIGTINQLLCLYPRRLLKMKQSFQQRIYLAAIRSVQVLEYLLSIRIKSRTSNAMIAFRTPLPKRKCSPTKDFSTGLHLPFRPATNCQLSTISPPHLCLRPLSTVIILQLCQMCRRKYLLLRFRTAHLLQATATRAATILGYCRLAILVCSGHLIAS